MTQPIKLTIHQSIYEEAIKQANENGGKVALYCKALLQEALKEGFVVAPPAGYEIIHNQTGRAMREGSLEVAKITMRLKQADSKEIDRLAALHRKRRREVMRIAITRQVIAYAKA
jgi:hypothetical protein